MSSETTPVAFHTLIVSVLLGVTGQGSVLGPDAQQYPSSAPAAFAVVLFNETPHAHNVFGPFAVECKLRLLENSSPAMHDGIGWHDASEHFQGEVAPHIAGSFVASELHCQPYWQQTFVLGGVHES